MLASLGPYREMLEPQRQHLLSFYRPVDVAFKVVGTGSVGLRDYCIYFEGNGPGDPLFLQIKEEPASAYAPICPTRTAAPQRPARGGRAARHAECSPTRSWAGRTSADASTWCASSTTTRDPSSIEDLAGRGLLAYAEVCGELLARGHARSGDPLVIAGYIGSGDGFAEALAAFARSMPTRRRRIGRPCGTKKSTSAWKHVQKLQTNGVTVNGEEKTPRLKDHLNRRTFAKGSLAADRRRHTCRQRPTRIPRSLTAMPYPLTVMLWTVFPDLPFEQRLEKVVESGYNRVELVGEYNKWDDTQFRSAVALRRRLGIHFDATAGSAHGVGDPSVRDAFLSELRESLKPMDALGCPAMIALSGNVVAGLSRDDQHKSCVETLKRAAEVIEGRQIEGQPVRLLLECIDPEENPKYYLQSAAEAIEVVRAVGHPQVQFLYDMFHEQIAEGNLMEKLLKEHRHDRADSRGGRAGAARTRYGRNQLSDILSRVAAAELPPCGGHGVQTDRRSCGNAACGAGDGGSGNDQRLKEYWRRVSWEQ